jgi:hypothetical protein
MGLAVLPTAQRYGTRVKTAPRETRLISSDSFSAHLQEKACELISLAGRAHQVIRRAAPTDRSLLVVGEALSAATYELATAFVTAGVSAEMTRTAID